MIELLIESLTSIPPITPQAAAAYEHASERLSEHVAITMETSPDIVSLIGGNAFKLMRNDQRNHVAFMATVFKINSYELLAKTIPWVYRAYQARGFSNDYFPAVLAAWKVAIAECLTAAHAAEIVQLYDWMLRQHDAMVQLAASAQGMALTPLGKPSEMEDALLSLLLHGNSKESLQLVDQSVRNAEDLKRFYLDVVCPVMCRIGLLWERNEVSVAEEHLATAIVGRISSALYSKLVDVRPFRGKAVVTAGPDEFHEMGARMLADFLEMDGWDVVYLGANTPPDAILSIVIHHRPFLVAISVATVFNLDKARHVVDMLKGDPDTRQAKVMVGGLAFNGLPLLWRDFGADGYAPDTNRAVITANAWWDERTP